MPNQTLDIKQTAIGWHVPGSGNGQLETGVAVLVGGGGCSQASTLTAMLAIAPGGLQEIKICDFKLDPALIVFPTDCHDSNPGLVVTVTPEGGFGGSTEIPICIAQPLPSEDAAIDALLAALQCSGAFPGTWCRNGKCLVYRGSVPGQNVNVSIVGAPGITFALSMTPSTVAHRTAIADSIVVVSKFDSIYAIAPSAGAAGESLRGITAKGCTDLSDPCAIVDACVRFFTCGTIRVKLAMPSSNAAGNKLFYKSAGGELAIAATAPAGYVAYPDAKILGVDPSGMSAVIEI